MTEIQLPLGSLGKSAREVLGEKGVLSLPWGAVGNRHSFHKHLCTSAMCLALCQGLLLTREIAPALEGFFARWERAGCSHTEEGMTLSQQVVLGTVTATGPEAAVESRAGPSFQACLLLTRSRILQTSLPLRFRFLSCCLQIGVCVCV